MSAFSGTPIWAIVAIAFAAGFLLCGYELLRSPSSSLFMEFYGADRFPYAMVAGMVFTAIFVYIYGWTITLVGTRRALLLTSLFSCFAITACYFALKRDIAPASLFLYAFREAYIVIIIEQYWSFINSILKEPSAKKLNGPVCGLGSLGSFIGGIIVGRWAVALGSETLLLFAAASLFPAALCSDLAYRLGGEPAPSERERRRKSLALSLFKDSSYLRRIGLLIILTQLISTTLFLRFSVILEYELPIKDVRTAYMGNFYAMIAFWAGVLQFVVAPLLLSYINLSSMHLAIPMGHIALAAALIARPSLITAALAYFMFKVLDYSIFRAGKEIFYIPLSFDCRYRAKEVIDSFGYRASKGGVAGLASLVRIIFGVVPGVLYSSAALAGALGWMLTVKDLVRQYGNMLEKRFTDSGEQERR